MRMQWSVLDYLPFLMEGIPWTLALVSGGLAMGFSLGLPLSLLETFGPGRLARLVQAYVWFFRGTPLLVLLSLIYWGLPSLGLRLSPFLASVLALGLRSGAYQSQIFRSALLSIEEGQLLAARSIGMTDLQAILHVMVPQALRIALPSWSNEYAIMLKDSSICFALGVMEILTRAKYVSTATDLALIPFLIAGVIYLVLTKAGVGLMELIQRRLGIPGFLGVSDCSGSRT